MSLTIGTPAPLFELTDQNGVSFSSATLIGQKNLVVLFYPFAFTGTCTGELCAIRDDLNAFQNEDVQLVAISCDSRHTQRAFSEAEGYKFPVLSDFWPHGAVSTTFGVFDDTRGCAVRGTFIVDKEGILRWQIVNGLGDARNNGDYKAAIAAL